MKLSTKGRYAMVALADLALAEAKSGGDDLVSLAAISKQIGRASCRERV